MNNNHHKPSKFKPRVLMRAMLLQQWKDEAEAIDAQDTAFWAHLHGKITVEERVMVNCAANDLLNWFDDLVRN